MSWTDTQWGDHLMAHMQQPAAGLASGGQSGSRIGNQVTCPSIVALTEMCAGPNIYNATGGNLYLTVDSFATWVWAWEMDNNSSSNTRLWLGEMEGFILLDGPTGEWRRVYFNKQPKGYVNAGSTADPNNPGDQIQVPGTAYASIRPDNNTPLEMWTQPFWPFVDNALMLRMYGFHVRVRAFIIGSDSANAHYMACAGIDPYKANSGLTDSYNPPKGFPSRSTDGGHGTYIEVGTEPMWITGTTVGPTGIVTGSSPPWTANWGSGPNWPWATVGAGRLLSEAQLRANLPPRPYELGGPYLYDHYQTGIAPAPAPSPTPAPAPGPAPAPSPTPTPSEPPAPIPSVTANANNWFSLDSDSAWAPLGEPAVKYISVEELLIVGVGDTTTFVFSATSNGGYPAPDRTITSVIAAPVGFATVVFSTATNGIGLFTVEITGVTIGAGTITILADGYSLAFGVSVVLPEDVPGNVLSSASAWSRALTR